MPAFRRGGFGTFDAPSTGAKAIGASLKKPRGLGVF